ncbi:hypothetical protein BLNAU_8817 [Blattamonas nauphoetae]|uniref:Uncharacterized protein n=1 Tax=Blattamonas nauphoetae TaxID=2049346 RepID=A0ABQ9XXM9_9EUKA|nr:hypothetical protein BLNAU_8817 [Blattamonas nauphoetae]
MFACILLSSPDAENTLAKVDRIPTNENTPSTNSIALFEAAARRATTNSTPSITAGFDGVFEAPQFPWPFDDLQSSRQFEGEGAMDELVTPQSPTGTEQQLEGVQVDDLDDELRADLSTILLCSLTSINFMPPLTDVHSSQRSTNSSVFMNHRRSTC